MNRLKSILLEHFNSGDSIYITSTIVLIILGYSTPYYQPTILDIDFKSLAADVTGSMFNKNKKYIECIKGLTNNRVAFGLINGSIIILDLMKNTTVIKLPEVLSQREINHLRKFVKHSIHFVRREDKYHTFEIVIKDNPLLVRLSQHDENNISKDRFLTYSINKICQIDENKIIYTMKHTMNIYVLNIQQSNSFEQIYITDNIRCVENDIINSNIVCLKKNTVAFVSISPCIKIINLETNKTLTVNFEKHHYPELIVFNDKLLIQTQKLTHAYTEILNIKDNGFHEHTQTKTPANPYENIKVIPCVNTVDVLFQDSYDSYKCSEESNNLLIFKQCYSTAALTLHNIKKNLNVCITENNTNFISAVYLNNGYVAMMNNKEIYIYNCVLKSVIQVISNVNKKYVALYPVSKGKFIALDDESNITLYS